DKDDEAHRETAETAELVHGDKFNKVVHRRVDPSSSLGQEHLPGVGSDSPCVRVKNVLGLVLAVILEQKSREVTILTQVEQILHVERVDADCRVRVDNLSTDEQRLARLSSTNAVHGETTWQTGNRT